jgi:hypothetical protein
MRARLVPILLVVAALVAVPAASASADAVQHSQHTPLHPVGTAQLRNGFVENIHANGPNVFAHEVYVVVGAQPNTTYDVTIAVYFGDPTCSSSPLVFPTATLTTSAGGGGKAQAFFTPEAADGLRHATHGAIWTLSVNGSPVYRTDCTTIVLD